MTYSLRTCSSKSRTVCYSPASCQAQSAAVQHRMQCKKYSTPHSPHSPQPASTAAALDSRIFSDLASRLKHTSTSCTCSAPASPCATTQGPTLSFRKLPKPLARAPRACWEASLANAASHSASEANPLSSSCRVCLHRNVSLLVQLPDASKSTCTQHSTARHRTTRQPDRL